MLFLLWTLQDFCAIFDETTAPNKRHGASSCIGVLLVENSDSQALPLPPIRNNLIMN